MTLERPQHPSRNLSRSERMLYAALKRAEDADCLTPPRQIMSRSPSPDLVHRRVNQHRSPSPYRTPADLENRRSSSPMTRRPQPMRRAESGAVYSRATSPMCLNTPQPHHIERRASSASSSSSSNKNESQIPTWTVNSPPLTPPTSITPPMTTNMPKRPAVNTAMITPPPSPPLQSPSSNSLGLGRPPSSASTTRSPSRSPLECRVSSPNFDARSAAMLLKNQEGYVSFADIEGLGEPEGVDCPDDEDCGEDRGRKQWWEVWRK